MVTRALAPAPALLATACTTSSGSKPSSSPSTNVTPAPTSSAPDQHSSAAASPAGCTNAELRVGHSAMGGATSHGGIVVIFTNTGSARCTLTGYPGAAVLNASGTQIEQAKRTKAGVLGGCNCTPRTVTLAPGGKASALIEGDNGGDECLRERALLVAPPNTERSTRRPIPATSRCTPPWPEPAAARSGRPLTRRADESVARCNVLGRAPRMPTYVELRPRRSDEALR